MRSDAESRKQAGFTLVELAIVMVIAGLVFAGIMGGVGLIHSAKLHSVVSDVGDFREGVSEFVARYEGLPGDIYNATELWADTTGGNNDGRLATWDTEGLQAWMQLARAGIVKGDYSGAPIGGAAVPGSNVPVSRFEGGGYSLYYVDAADADWDHGDTPGTGGVTILRNSQGNMLILGRAAAASFTSSGLLSQEDALSIDNKMDDGWPDSGQVQSPVGTSCTDTPGAQLEYDVANNLDGSCALAFRLEVE